MYCLYAFQMMYVDADVYSFHHFDVELLSISKVFAKITPFGCVPFIFFHFDLKYELELALHFDDATYTCTYITAKLILLY